METQLIYLARHGETPSHKRGVYQGYKINESLNETGIEQAGLLGKSLKKYFPMPSIIYSSPALRALETACIIKNELVGTRKYPEIHQIHDLHEINHGDWEGRTDQEIKNEYPELLELWLKDPMRIAFPGEGGEVMEEAQIRILNAFHYILKQSRRRKAILIVAHGGTNLQILSEIIGTKYIRSFAQGQTCLNIIARSGKTYQILLLNSLIHLAETAQGMPLKSYKGRLL